MKYLSTYPGFKELEQLFYINGIHLSFDLGNTFCFSSLITAGQNIEYDQLPDTLKTALTTFTDLNFIEC